MAQSVEHATTASTFTGLGQSLLFGQNLGTCVSCAEIGKMKTVITSVTSTNIKSFRGCNTRKVNMLFQVRPFCCAIFEIFAE